MTLVAVDGTVQSSGVFTRMMGGGATGEDDSKSNEFLQDDGAKLVVGEGDGDSGEDGSGADGGADVGFTCINAGKGS